MANLGYEVDKKVPVVISEQFDKMVQDANVIEAVELILGMGEDVATINKATADGLMDTLLRIQKTYGGDTSVLAAVQALTQYWPHKDAGKDIKFESDLTLEIDGLANGFSITLLQFPMFRDPTVLEAFLNKTGTYVGKGTKHLQDGIFADGQSHDVYLDLAALVKQFNDIGTAEVYFANRSKDGAPRLNKKTGLPVFKHGTRDYANREAALNYVSSAIASGAGGMRKLVKYPFLIFNFSGGIKSISEGVAKEIIDDMYTEYNRLQKGYRKGELTVADLKEFSQHAATLGAVRNPQELIDVIQQDSPGARDPRKFKFIHSELRSNISELVAPRFERALETLLGDIEESRNSVVHAVTVLNAVFNVHFDDLMTARANDPKTRNIPMSDKAILRLIKENLLDFFPGIPAAIMDQEAKDVFLDLTQRSSVIGKTDSASTVAIQYTDSNGKPKTTSTSPNTREFVDPSVSGLVRFIQNMDSAQLTRILSKNPKMLALHDAVQANPKKLVDTHTQYGEEYLTLAEEFGILDQVTKRMNKVLKKTAALDVQKKLPRSHKLSRIGRIDKALFANEKVTVRNAKGFPVQVGLDGITTQVRRESINVNNARATAFRLLAKDGRKSSQLVYNHQHPDSPEAAVAPKTAHEQQVAADVEATKKEIVIANLEVDTLPANVTNQIIARYTPDVLVDLFHEYAPEYALEYVQLAVADTVKKDGRKVPRYNTVSQAIAWIDRFKQTSDTAIGTKQQFLASLLDASTTSSLLEDFARSIGARRGLTDEGALKLGKRAITEIKKKIPGQLNTYARP